MLTTLAVTITSGLYIIYCYRKYAPIVLWNFQKDKSKYKEMMSFSGWVLLGAAAYIGKVQGAALIINVFFGTILNASFGIANQVNQLILMFTQNLGQAAVPQITKSYSSGNSDRTIQLVFYMTKYSFFLMLLPALPILLETNFLLNLWLKEVPEYTALFCQLMILGALIECLNTTIPAAIQATGKIKYLIIIQSPVLLSGLLISWILFKYGCAVYSILIVSALTSIANVIFCLIFLKKLVHFDIKRLFKASYLKILYVVIGVSPLFLIKNFCNEGVYRFIFLSLTAVTWFAIVVYFVGIERNERLKFKSGVVQIYSKLRQDKKLS